MHQTSVDTIACIIIVENTHYFQLKKVAEKFYLGALSALLKNLGAKPAAVEGNGGFGVRVRGFGQRQSTQLLLQRQSNPVSLQLRLIQRLTKKYTQS